MKRKEQNHRIKDFLGWEREGMRRHVVGGNIRKLEKGETKEARRIGKQEKTP